MPDNNSLGNQPEDITKANAGKLLTLLRNPVTLGLLVFVILAGLFAALTYQRYYILKQMQMKEAFDVAKTTEEKLHESITHSLSATRILAFFIDNNGTVNNFDSVASQLITADHDIDALQLVPQGVIRYVYPLKGNEKVIGYNILEDSTRNKEAYKAIEKKQLYFAGPLDLRQGGKGVVGRLPIFRNGTFWGFSAVVIKLTTLFNAAGIDTSDSKGYYFQLSKINPDTKEEETFIHHGKEVARGQSVTVNVPDGEWKLSVTKGTVPGDLNDVFLFTVIGLFFSGLGALLIFNVAQAPKKLDKLVKERTQQFKESEEKFSKVFHSSVLGFAIYDTNFILIDVNEPYLLLLESTREQVIGKHSDEVGLVSKIHPPKRTLTHEKIEQILAADGYIESLEIEIETTRGEILTMLLSIERLEFNNNKYWLTSAVDITEKKKAELLLKESEEKYRLLFYSNPLPMWMTTIPGLDIIDVNEAAINQYGYSREEFLKLNTRQLRPAEDVENFLKEVDKMEPGIINLRAWRHKKKDGTIINVETYSHQIMYEGRMVWLGLSHDVTEKYKASELLEKSYEDIRLLASNLQSIREDERTNIAREIHDELGQQLTGLKMDMHWLNRRIKSEDDEVNKKMKDSIELVNSTITTVRKIATDLRPSILDDLGLLAALEWQSEEFERRSGTKVTFTNNVGDITVLPVAATALFRIYQELLTNIARHANATETYASLDSDDKNLYFSIRDNGVGFSLDTINMKKTLGLLGIKERTFLIGGTYEMKSEPEKGSEIIISIPIDLVRKQVKN